MSLYVSVSNQTDAEVPDNPSSAGQFLERIIFPGVLSAAVTLKDGGTTFATFPLGIGPMSIEIGCRSVNGGWMITVGALDTALVVYS